MTVNPRVIKYFIKFAPVGELYTVLSDVGKIAGKECLNMPDIRDAIRDHLETHHQHVKVEGKMCMVNKEER